MTKIKNYIEDTNISEADILLGTDKDDISKTKNYKIGRLKDYILSFVSTIVGPQGPQGETGPQGPPGESASANYKIYRALITQTSTNAPTVIVLENTIGSIVWSRNSPGTYSATLVGAFQANKTFYPTFGTSNSFNRVYTNRLNDDVMSIISISEDFTAYLDNELFNYPIEIIVYN